MMSKFNKNCIITGVAGSFCLLCHTFLTKNDLGGHIAASDHKDKLESSAYVEKYKDEFIRKVKTGYYCETCNALLQTSSKVAIHVNDSAHRTNRKYQLLHAVDGGVIAFGDLFIDKRAWNGMNNDSCYICNVDYCDENDHLNQSSHILYLIQGKFELKRGKCVYRKVDGTFLNCLVCNNLISSESKDSHVRDADHLNNYAKCQKNMENHKVQSENTETIKKSVKPVDTKPTSEENLDERKIKMKDKISHTDSTKSANCEDELNNTTTICGGILTPDEAWKNKLQFAKENHLKCKRNGTYCDVCDVKISSSLQRLKEHVAEPAHKEKLITFEKKVAVKKMRTAEFVNTITAVNHLFGIDIIINGKFFLSNISFDMMTQHGTKLRCQLCEVFLEGEAIIFHRRTPKHVCKMRNTLVLLWDTEFTREMRPGKYHCGFCNFIEASWEGLINHLNSTDHKEQKLRAEFRLAIISSNEM